MAGVLLPVYMFLARRLQWVRPYDRLHQGVKYNWQYKCCQVSLVWHARERLEGCAAVAGVVASVKGGCG